MNDTDPKPTFDELKAWMAKGEPEDLNPTADTVYNLTQRLSMSNRTHPLALEASGMLGSRLDDHVILHTGQLYYEEQLITLGGNLPIKLALHYISHEPYDGMFGPHWRFHYESNFNEMTNSQERGYRLIQVMANALIFRMTARLILYVIIIMLTLIFVGMTVRSNGLN